LLEKLVALYRETAFLMIGKSKPTEEGLRDVLRYE
jgi:hypothetical protein